MNTIIFIGMLIAITYMLSSSGSSSKTKKKKSGGQQSFRKDSQSAGQMPLIDKGAMLRCHNCGAFFPESRAVKSVVQDVELHFCSQNCKTNFRIQ